MKTWKDSNSEDILSFPQTFVQYIDILRLVIYSVVFHFDILLLF